MGDITTHFARGKVIELGEYVVRVRRRHKFNWPMVSFDRKNIFLRKRGMFASQRNGFAGDAAVFAFLCSFSSRDDKRLSLAPFLSLPTTNTFLINKFNRIFSASAEIGFRMVARIYSAVEWYFFTCRNIVEVITEPLAYEIICKKFAFVQCNYKIAVKSYADHRACGLMVATPLNQQSS